MPEIRVPAVGESISEVVVARWLKPDGSQVQQDEPVVALETDKANVDVPAPAAGTLRISRAEGATAQIGEVLGAVDIADTTVVRLPQPPTSAPDQPVAATPPLASAPSAVLPTPLPAPLAGSGGIARPGVPPAVATPPSTRAAVATRRERVVPMSPIRRRIAARLVQAQHSAAMLTTFNEADMSAVQALRLQHQAGFQARHGVKLGLMSFFVRAAVCALQEFPEVGAEIRGTDIVYHDDYDICVAVGGGRGLVVPVLRHADRLGFPEIERAIADFAARARESRLMPDELQGGMFTISNGGVYGSLLSTPILNPPQSGILGLHQIQQRGVAVEGRLELRPMMYLALSYDHRIVDGQGAVSFLKRIKELVEQPARMLVGV